VATPRVATPRRALDGRFLPTRATALRTRAAMDVGPSAPPVEDFAGYNTARSKDLHATLVGNWVEERQLEADTGVFRYKPWVEELPSALAPGAYRHQSLPREDARPRRRAFRATRGRRVDHRRQVVARRPGGGVSRRAVRFRPSRRAENSGGFAADVTRGFRGAARAP
jgi:hypothetical protein